MLDSTLFFHINFKNIFEKNLLSCYKLKKNYFLKGGLLKGGLLKGGLL